jgi:alcohol dehydrogenase
LLIGLGGGSSLDCAKGVNFLYTNGGQMPDYWGVGKAKWPMLPMIAVPTTAGTGSEAQSFALISDAQTHVKMACGDKKAACRVAILDPRLTLTQPQRVTALTGIDAVAHAVETYVTNKRNPVSQVFSREAWRLLAANFGLVLEHPGDMTARGAMQLGACFAGLAIENSMLGAAHGLANPLTAHYGIPHGQAVGVMLPHVIRFNAAAVGPAYRELLESDGGRAVWPASDEGAAGLADFVTALASRAGLEIRLAACGVEESRLPALAAEAAGQWTTSFNPRPADAAALLAVYRQAF